jgi:hypothetical protein
MIRNLIVVLVLGLAAWLAYDNSREISESDVHNHYQDQLKALRESDEEALCKTAAEDFSLQLEQVGAAPQKLTMDRHDACEQLKMTLKLMQLISTQSGGLLSIDFAYDIKSIGISPDGRTATVEITSTAKIGDRLLARSRGTERLSRSFWRVRSHGGESKTWAYGG